MNRTLKLIAYVVLAGCVCWTGYNFGSLLRRVPPRPLPSVDPPLAAAGTNELVTTNPLTAGTNPPPAASTSTPSAAPGPPQAVRAGSWAGYFGAFLISTLGFGLLLAYDLSHFFAARFHAFILDENAETEKDPEYEEAEKLWADGQHLEAIQHMRDFLKRKPYAVYAAVRIAEIYEKDLGNYLASALEYEEILKKDLPDEHWGWTAIHLANLYNGKLNQPTKAETLLKRIVDRYPKTAAARKARERLGLPQPSDEPPPAEPEEPPPQPPPEPPSNLPPGFRPK
jgi:TolA-binding protein